MPTSRQIEANRRNALLSTGPRTPEGKSVSRLNALKSGINARTQVIPGEDPAELQAMADGYHQEWQPATSLERFLVDSLVRAEWLLQRLSRIEAELWTHQIADVRSSSFGRLDEKSPLGDIYSRNYDRFARLQRRIDSTERSYYRALQQLQRVRASREAAQELEPLPTDPPAPGPDQQPELGSFRHDPVPAGPLPDPAGDLPPDEALLLDLSAPPIRKGYPPGPSPA